MNFGLCQARSSIEELLPLNISCFTLHPLQMLLLLKKKTFYCCGRLPQINWMDRRSAQIVRACVVCFRILKGPLMAIDLYGILFGNGRLSSGAICQKLPDSRRNKVFSVFTNNAQQNAATFNKHYHFILFALINVLK